MERDKLKLAISPMLGKVNPTDLKRWVSCSERQPTEEKYYIVLRGDSNPNYVHGCKPAVHFWYADKKEWSSETTYWLEDIQTENEKVSN